jgi:hypothetical protein
MRTTHQLCLAANLLFLAVPTRSEKIVKAIRCIKSSVVGIGTDFVVADGQHVMTNAHAVASPLDATRGNSHLACFLGRRAAGARSQIVGD